jgi:hypothetical protein
MISKDEYEEAQNIVWDYEDQILKSNSDLGSVSKNKPLPPPPPKDREIHISGESRHKR